MEVVDHVSAVLKHKGTEIWTISPEATVYEAIELMATREIGSLLVMKDEALVGIVTERDYARKIILRGRSSRDTTVAEAMVAPPLTVSPECPVNEAMKSMTEARVRHLPVIGSRGEVLGLISIGDLVKWIITSQNEMIQHLHTYISGSS